MQGGWYPLLRYAMGFLNKGLTHDHRTPHYLRYELDLEA